MLFIRSAKSILSIQISKITEESISFYRLLNISFDVCPNLRSKLFVFAVLVLARYLNKKFSPVGSLRPITFCNPVPLLRSQAMRNRL